MGDPVELLYDALEWSMRGDVAAAERALKPWLSTGASAGASSAPWRPFFDWPLGSRE